MNNKARCVGWAIILGLFVLGLVFVRLVFHTSSVEHPRLIMFYFISGVACLTGAGFFAITVIRYEMNQMRERRRDRDRVSNYLGHPRNIGRRV